MTIDQPNIQLHDLPNSVRHQGLARVPDSAAALRQLMI